MVHVGPDSKGEPSSAKRIPPQILPEGYEPFPEGIAPKRGTAAESNQLDPGTLVQVPGERPRRAGNAGVGLALVLAVERDNDPVRV